MLGPRSRRLQTWHGHRHLLRFKSGADCYSNMSSYIIKSLGKAAVWVQAVSMATTFAAGVFHGCCLKISEMNQNSNVKVWSNFGQNQCSGQSVISQARENISSGAL